MANSSSTWPLTKHTFGGNTQGANDEFAVNMRLGGANNRSDPTGTQVLTRMIFDSRHTPQNSQIDYRLSAGKVLEN